MCPDGRQIWVPRFTVVIHNYPSVAEIRIIDTSALYHNILRSVKQYLPECPRIGYFDCFSDKTFFDLSDIDNGKSIYNKRTCNIHQGSPEGGWRISLRKEVIHMQITFTFHVGSKTISIILRVKGNNRHSAK